MVVYAICCEEKRRKMVQGKNGQTLSQLLLTSTKASHNLIPFAVFCLFKASKAFEPVIYCVVGCELLQIIALLRIDSCVPDVYD